MKEVRATKSDISGSLLHLIGYAPDSFPKWMKTTLDAEFAELREQISAYRTSFGKNKKHINYEEVDLLLGRSFAFYSVGRTHDGAVALDCVRHIFDNSREVRAEFIEAFKREVVVPPVITKSKPKGVIRTFLDALFDVFKVGKHVREVSPKKSADDLLHETLVLAIRMIQEHGSHVPFAIGLTVENEFERVVADDSMSGVTTEMLFETVLAEIKQRCESGHYLVVALAQNVEYLSAQDGTAVDAIQVDIDEMNKTAVRCFLPYYRDSNGVVIPREVVAVDTVRRFFNQ